MEENTNTDKSTKYETTDTEQGYQVLACNVKWIAPKTSTNVQTEIVSSRTKTKFSELPEMFSIDIPENVLRQATKKRNNFNDVIESFCYSYLTRRFGFEVGYCQLWLPLEDAPTF